MKKIFYLFAFLSLLTNQTMGQNPSAGLSYRVSGKLTDPATKEAVSFASAALYRLPDSVFVKGIASDIAGKFLLTELPEGTYFLKISQVGYKSKFLIGIQLNASNPNHDAGQIQLLTDSEKLKEVQVVAEKGIVEHALDKQVINVAKDLNAVGGTATDALRNAPSITVDIDGNVSVRGSANVTVLVDGRNTGQSAQTILGQTPASAIEKIEVITNPGAKYDAEGMGGIINIVLKKETRNGFNGNVALNAGTYDNHNLSLNLNYRYRKFNFFGGYDGITNYRRGNYQLERSTTFEGSTTFLDQRQHGRRIAAMHIPKLGFDYNISDKQSLTVSVKQFGNSSNETETVTNGVSNTSRTEDYYFSREGENEFRINVTDYSLSYRKTFERKGQELTGSAVFTTIDGGFDRFFEQYDTDLNQNRISGGDLKENYLQDFYVKPFFAQLDYVHPIGEKGKLETGLKRSQRILTTEFIGDKFDYATSEYYRNLAVSNKFGYDEYVNAGYVNYGGAFKKLTYQVGLRAEQTDILVTDKGSNKEYPSNYFNLFPSVFVSQEINENLKLQLNYSRRINRPNYE